MRKTLVNSIYLFITCCLLAACGSDPAEDNNNDGGHEGIPKVTASDTKAANGQLVGLRNNMLQLEGADPIQLEADSSVVTIILLRPAETIGAKSSLSPEGQMRADGLSKVFAQSGIEQIYCEGNAAMQTAMMTSRSNQSNLGLVKDSGTDELAKTIVKNFKGKRVMLIGNANMISVVLSQLSGTNTFQVAEDEYDNVYVVRSKALGDSEVLHFKY